MEESKDTRSKPDESAARSRTVTVDLSVAAKHIGWVMVLADSIAPLEYVTYHGTGEIMFEFVNASAAQRFHSDVQELLKA